MTESEAYTQITAELNSGRVQKSEWARAMVMASGEYDKQKAIYIDLRLAKLIQRIPLDGDVHSSSIQPPRVERQAMGSKLVVTSAIIGMIGMIGIFSGLHILGALFLLSIPMYIWGRIWEDDKY